MANMQDRANRSIESQGADVNELLSKAKPGTAGVLIESFLGGGDPDLPKPSPGQIENIIADVAGHVADETLFRVFEYARDRAAELRSEDDGGNSIAAVEYDHLADFVWLRLDKKIDYVNDPQAPQRLAPGEGVMERIVDDPSITVKVLERFLDRGDDMRLPLATPRQVRNIVEWVAGPLDAAFLGELREHAVDQSVRHASENNPDLAAEFGDLAAFLEKWIAEGPPPEEID